MKRILLYATAVGIGLACSRHIEEDVDVERLCRDFCDLAEDCEPEAPAWLTSCPGTEASCFDTCMESGGWEGDCRFKRADKLECIASLTCEELHEQSACSPVPRQDQPCQEESWEYDLCRSKQ